MKNNYTSMPALIIPEEEKTPEWWNNYEEGRAKDIRNYQIYNGQLNQDDYAYITEQYGLTYPARLVNYPIITPKIDLLVGESLRRPLDMKVSTVNKEAVLRKHDFKVGLIMTDLLKDIHQEFEETQGIRIKDQGKGIAVPEDIETYMKYNYREMVEEVAQDGLEYIINRYHVKDIFKEGFRDLLVTGKSFYKTYIKNGDPYVRRVDPRTIVFDGASHSDYLDDASWVGEERYMTVNEINDEFKEDLTESDLVELDKMRNLYGGSPDLKYYNSSFDWIDAGYGKETRIRVVSCEWKSLRALKFKVSDNLTVVLVLYFLLLVYEGNVATIPTFKSITLNKRTLSLFTTASTTLFSRAVLLAYSKFAVFT